MKTSLPFLLVLTLYFLVLSSCVKDQTEVELLYYSKGDYEVLNKTLNLPAEPHEYNVAMPAHFGFAPLFSNGAPLSNSRATVGRVLFYDKNLSANNKVSCASCHDQKQAFADPVAFSEGFEGKATKRNSFALGAVASFASTYNDNNSSSAEGSALFWDNRASTIVEQSTQTLQDPIEMGMDLKLLADKLNQQDYYRILFKKAYYTDQIDEHMVLDAISHFVNSMVTINTKFDEGFKVHHQADQDFANFTAAENRGKELYNRSCAGCHGGEMIRTEVSVANNGLDKVYEDKGMGEVMGSNMNGVFKVPLLRNIALTGPYMHDGRFETLDEVIDHYATGVREHPNLHPLLSEGRDHMNFTDQDKKDLISFLHTLTDSEFIAAERFSNPFKF